MKFKQFYLEHEHIITGEPLTRQKPVSGSRVIAFIEKAIQENIKNSVVVKPLEPSLRMDFLNYLRQMKNPIGRRDELSDDQKWSTFIKTEAGKRGETVTSFNSFISNPWQVQPAQWNRYSP